MSNYIVYYMKPDFFRDFVMGHEVPSVARLEQTHTFLTIVSADDLEDVFVKMQAENWSPNGEARSLIQSKELEHTSMSVGDVMYDPDNRKWFAVSGIGFKELDK